MQVTKCPTELDSDRVDLWHAALNVSDPHCHALRQVLTDEECRRADRIRIDRPRRQFIVARATLRHVLARYLRQRPEQVGLTCDAHGKPRLVHSDGDADLCFNLSHSHDLALFAVAWQRPVGVDVEHVRPTVRCDALAGRFFSPYEVEALQALPPAERRAAFFACWTRKEAFLKAKGTGLRLPLNQFDVTVEPDGPARLLRVCWDPAEVGHWHLDNLQIEPGYAAALAVRGSAAAVRYRGSVITSNGGA